MRKLLPIAFLLFAGVSLAQTQYCWRQDGVCYPLPSVLGCPPPSVTTTVPCPATTPTPVPTVGPTATPTLPPTTPTPTPGAEPQPEYTIFPLFYASDVGYTYVQAMSMVNGLLFGNGGVCCPGLDDPKGKECIFVIDYRVSPPKFRELWCSQREPIKEVWEVGTVQVSSSESFQWAIAGTQTRRPAVDALVPGHGEAPAALTDGIAWCTGMHDPMKDQIQNPGVALERDGWRIWTQGAIELHGHRWMYVQYMKNRGEEFPQKFRLARFLWQDAWKSFVWAESTYFGLREGPEMPPVSGIAMDSDGTLITTTGWFPDATNPVVKVLRSKDEGKTFYETGIVFNRPAGKYITGCGWVKNGAGVAEKPWQLICLQTTGKGPDVSPVSDWNAVAIRCKGAKTYPGFGAGPVK